MPPAEFNRDEWAPEANFGKRDLKRWGIIAIWGAQGDPDAEAALRARWHFQGQPEEVARWSKRCPPGGKLDATAQARYKKASRPLREWQLRIRRGAKDDYEAWQRRLEVPGQTWPRATWDVFYGELTPDQRAVVRLRLLGRSGRETARMLGCDEKMVRKHLHRAEVMLWFALWVTDAPSQAYEAADRRRAKSLGSALHLEVLEPFSRGRDVDGGGVGVAPFLSPLFGGIRKQGVMT